MPRSAMAHPLLFQEYHKGTILWQGDLFLFNYLFRIVSRRLGGDEGEEEARKGKGAREYWLPC